jgi:excisionase family DNA binding protein
LQAIARYLEGVVGTATEELLSLPEAGDRLGVSVYTVRRWIKDGKLRAFKPGKEYRIREADLEEFLRAREVHPKAPPRSPFEPSLLNGLEEERPTPSLQGWIVLVEDLVERWGPEIDHRTQEIADASQAGKRMKRLTAATWAVELHHVYGAVVDGFLEDPLFPDAYGPGEHARLWRALRDMKELLDRTDSWFERDAQVADIRQAIRVRDERLKEKLGPRAS